jgi:hypothetical protein
MNDLRDNPTKANRRRRVATTITNVEEGTLGDRLPNHFALIDALHTAQDQLTAIRRDGCLTYDQSRELYDHLEAVRKIIWAQVIEAADKQRAESVQALEAYNLRHPDDPIVVP